MFDVLNLSQCLRGGNKKYFCVLKAREFESTLGQSCPYSFCVYHIALVPLGKAIICIVISVEYPSMKWKYLLVLV